MAKTTTPAVTPEQMINDQMLAALAAGDITKATALSQMIGNLRSAATDSKRSAKAKPAAEPFKILGHDVVKYRNNWYVEMRSNFVPKPLKRLSVAHCEYIVANIDAIRKAAK